MDIHRTKAEMRAARSDLARDDASLGLVPTMGFLHDGHMALVRRARAECDRVVVSIFVNPTQFGPGEDYSSYPRDTDRDLEILRKAGTDAVFLPEAGEIYAEDAETVVEPARLSRILIGRLRPGHFGGVATIVAKLFNLVQPHAAYFGQKDYQQLCVIRRMVRDLDIPVRVEGVPIVREKDGLAMSSRNVRLSEAHRRAAPVLHAALQDGRRTIEAGEGVTAAGEAIRARLADAPEGRIESVDLRDAASLQPLRGAPSRSVVMLLAVRFGDVLLIDNMIATPRETE